MLGGFFAVCQQLPFPREASTSDLVLNVGFMVRSEGAPFFCNFNGLSWSFKRQGAFRPRKYLSRKPQLSVDPPARQLKLDERHDLSPEFLHTAKDFVRC